MGDGIGGARREDGWEKEGLSSEAQHSKTTRASIHKMLHRAVRPMRKKVTL